MYNVSEKFKQSINQLSVKSIITGEITTKAGGKIDFNSDMIGQGSFSINGKCVSNNDFELGSVYAQELSFTLKTPIDRYALYDAKVKASFSLNLSDGTWETIPLGVFNITEAFRVGHNVTIKAVDNMVLLDDEDLLTFGSTDGTPYQLLSLISELSGVELAQTEQEIELLTNGEHLLGFDDSDVVKPNTLRDILSYVATATGTFATANREGKLELRDYRSSANVVLNIDKAAGVAISDYSVNYQSVRASLGSTTLTVSNEAQGQMLMLKDNPFFENLGEDETRVYLTNIIGKISQITFVPCELSYSSGNPAIDLGDMIEVTDPSTGHVAMMLVMSLDWKHRGRQQIKCLGSNPRLSKMRSKEDAALGDVASKVSETETVYNSYTNIKALTVSEGDLPLSILKVAYVAKKETMGEFKALIKFDSLAGPITVTPETTVTSVQRFDMVFNDSTSQWEKNTWQEDVETVTGYIVTDQKSILTMTYKIDDSIITGSEQVEVRRGGQQSVWLYYPLERITPGLVHKLEVILTVEGSSIVIPKFGVNAMLIGQGMASTKVVWDGTLTIEEEVPVLTVSNGSKHSFAQFIESVSTDVPLKRETIISLGVPEFVVQNPPAGYVFAQFDDSVVASSTIKTSVISVGRVVEYSTKYVDTSASKFKQQKTYSVPALEQPIDSGLMATISIDTVQFIRIDGIEVI